MPTYRRDGQPNETPTKEHFALLDQCRGLAIILVFLCHCTLNFTGVLNAALYDPVSFIGQVLSGKISLTTLIEFLCFYPCRLGWSGVAVFFVVSGFCIHQSYSQSARPDLIAFYVRRFFRLYPPYFVAILVFGLFFPYSRLLFDRLGDWARLFAHLLLCHNLSAALGGISASYWTIPVEAQLYLLFPVLLFLVGRYSFAKTLWIVGIIQFSLHIITALSFGLYRPPPFLISASPFYYWFSWSIGAAIVDAYLKRQPLPFQKTSPWLWLTAAIATSAFAAHEFTFTFFALATASLIARRLTTSMPAARQSFFGRSLRVTGTYSYGIYLIHHPLVVGVTESYKRFFPGIENNPGLMFSAALSSWLIIFPLGALTYYLLERPSISFGKRLLKARSRRLIRQSSSGMTSEVDVVF
jgi:peptidoglycan/LPS O-acetylase OafA/YrhL